MEATMVHAQLVRLGGHQQRQKRGLVGEVQTVSKTLSVPVDSLSRNTVCIQANAHCEVLVMTCKCGTARNTHLPVFSRNPELLSRGHDGICVW